MWQHDIAAIRRRRISSPEVSRLVDGMYASVAFYMGDTLQACSQGRIDPAPLRTMPFPSMTIECSARDGLVAIMEVERAAVYLQDREDHVDAYMFLFIEGTWHPSSLLFSLSKSDGEECVAREVDGGMFDSLPQEAISYFGSMVAWIATTAITAINACNTCYKRVVPPDRLNHNRVRKGKLPIKEYRILEITPGKVKEKDAGEVQWGYRSPEAKAFHLCRGHFKTYTPEHPLFGKYVGTFWWQAQARGDKVNGEVVKDYVVRD